MKYGIRLTRTGPFLLQNDQNPDEKLKFQRQRAITIVKAIKPQAKYLTLSFLLKDIYHGSH